MAMGDIVEAGRRAATQVGVCWRDVPRDDRWHGVPVEGKDLHNKAGRIRLFLDAEGGHVWNHTTGAETVFWARGDVDLDPQECAIRRQRAEECRQRAEAEQKQAAVRTVKAARALWQAGHSGPNPYLVRKGDLPMLATLRQIEAEAAGKVLGYRPRVGDDHLTGLLLLVPIKVGDWLSSMQLIEGDGRKYFLPGGILKAGFWSTNPLPADDDDQVKVQIAEGVSTALSCHLATNIPTLAALSCGNLLAVAVEVRRRYPRAAITICSDRGNGEADARRAASAVGALLVVPEFSHVD